MIKKKEEGDDIEENRTHELVLELGQLLFL